MTTDPETGLTLDDALDTIADLQSDLATLESALASARSEVEALLQGQRDLAEQTVKIRRAALGNEKERPGIDTEEIVRDLRVHADETDRALRMLMEVTPADVRAEAAEATAERLRGALRETSVRGALCWCGVALGTQEHSERCARLRHAMGAWFPRRPSETAEEYIRALAVSPGAPGKEPSP